MRKSTISVGSRGGAEIKGLNLEKRRKSEDLKLGCLRSWPTCFSGRLD